MSVYAYKTCSDSCACYFENEHHYFDVPSRFVLWREFQVIASTMRNHGKMLISYEQYIIVYAAFNMNFLQGLPSPIKDRLEKAGIKSSNLIITLPDFDLLSVTDLNEEECELVKMHISKKYAGKTFLSAGEAQNILGKRWMFLSTGCSVLDSFLGGGYALRGITEIAGESSCGKTQFCLQAALSVQLPESRGGLAAGAAYICTEDTFPSSRLQQLIKSWLPKYEDHVSIGDNIFIEHIPDGNSLRNCICVRLPNLLHQRQVGLVVIDSIAGAFRSDYDEEQGAIDRAEEFQTIALKLYELANEHRLAVICVNQVTAVPGDCSSDPTLVPALGLSWANLVTTRLQLHRSWFGDNTSSAGPSVGERFIEVIFSPYLPKGNCQFVVTESGVQGVTESVL